MINQILIGDVLEKLKEIPDQYVNTVVTSPPYWGLRDYGVDGQIGLEKTPEEYVEKMVSVFQEVRRVLRDDGTLWLNLGDSYAQKGGRQVSDEEYEKKRERAELTGCNVGGWGASKKRGQGASGRAANTAVNGLKPKDLVGIPWMVAFALRADGWYLRQDIIWHKPNPMPESVTDRCTKAHEYIFLLSKSRQYYYDADAIREPAKSITKKMPDGLDAGPGAHGSFHRNGRERGKKTDKQRGHGRRHAGFNDRWDLMTKEEQCSIGRNKRSVWTVSTKPFPGAHFATFPPDLIDPCILAGCPYDGLVLDPFFGSGSVGLVALKNARHYIGIELNPEYAEMARNRIEYGTVDKEKVIEEKKQGTLFDDR